jgi:hypothetical protein
MDEATLAVVGSIAAALLGSLVGAAINQRAARALEVRREEREAGVQQVRLRAAARLVFSELRLAQLAVDSILKRRTFTFGTVVPPDTAWATHGVLLAAALSEAEYDAVASACAKVAVWFRTKLPNSQLVADLSGAGNRIGTRRFEQGDPRRDRGAASDRLPRGRRGQLVALDQAVRGDTVPGHARHDRRGFFHPTTSSAAGCSNLQRSWTT